MQNRNSLRQHFRQQRRDLSREQQQAASQTLLERCLSLAEFQNAENLAFYLANDGELDPMPVIQYCWQQQKKVYLPVLHPFSSGHLLFVAFTPDSPIRANHYGIAEPVIRCRDICPLEQLDIIFSPLVAFDTQGNRLGMGGGFYDRTLSPILRDKLTTKVIGLAHQCQQTEQLPYQHWDIPMQKIIAV